MDIFDLFATIKLDSSEYEQGLVAAEGKANGFGSMISGGFSTAMKVGAAAVGAASAAVVAFGKSSIDAATEYESAFAGVRKTVDATEEEYQELSDWIMDASTRMASSKEEIAATMEIAGQLGVSGTEGLKTFTETMIMLGDTTNLNAEEAAGALARFGNIAGLLPEDMGRIGSVIVDLGNHFATTESDIVQMATRLASAGTIAGLSATDILALSTAMSSVGIQAEAGGTAMSQTLAEISKAVDVGGESLNAFATVAGMSAESFATVWKGSPIDAVTAFIEGLHNLNEADESVIMTLDNLGLKGIRQSNMLQSLALASDMMRGAVDMANESFEENVALVNEANVRYGTTESKAKQASEAFKNLRTVIGEELKPAYGELLSFSSNAFEAMREGLDKGGLEGLMASFGVAISDSINAVSEKLPEIINLGMSLVGALGQGVIDNLPTIASAATEIVVKIVEGLGQALPQLAEGAITLLQSLAQSISENSETLLQAGSNILTMLWDGITQGLPILAEGAITLMNNLASYLQEALPQLLPVALNAVMEFSGSLRENAGNLIDGALALIMALADGLIESLPAMIETIPTIVTNIAGIINDNAPKLLASGIELIGKLIAGIIESVPTLIEEFPKIIQAIFAVITAVNWISLGTHIITFIGNGIQSLASSLPDLLKSIGQNANDFLKNIDWKGLGSTIIDFIVNGVKALINDLPNTLKSIGTTALDWVKGIDWKGLGSSVINFIVDGVKSLINNVPNTLKSIGEDALKQFKEIDWIGLGTNIVAGIASGITNGAFKVMDAIGSMAKDAWDSVTSFFDTHSPSRKMAWLGQMLDEGMAKGITKNADMVDDAMRKLEILPELDFSIPNVSMANGANMLASQNNNNVTINVYGAQGQDVSELAEIVSRKIDSQVKRRGAAWA